MGFGRQRLNVRQPVAMEGNLVKIGFHLTPFWSPTDRSPTQIIDEVIEVVAASSKLGFDWISIGHHWLSSPTVWPKQFPFLARVAPETGSMQLKTSVLLLPLMNPIDVAENVATLDHISHGQFVLGISIGYREQELRNAGLTRKDRVPKLEESRFDEDALVWAGDDLSRQVHAG
jgi:alkanesulfonate monooxygenase SsuD/methylene tetrahydromethanopterin reductase-like flavin-dependent oxidoreductase (luciferase family)